MLQRLTSPVLLEFAYEQIAALFRAHAEWLYVGSDGTSQSLRRDAREVAIVHKRFVLSCWTEKGNRLWRILAWNWTGEALELETSRRMGRDRELIQLIPRTSAKHVARSEERRVG